MDNALAQTLLERVRTGIAGMTETDPVTFAADSVSDGK